MNRKIPLHISILMIFVTLVLAITAILTAVNYASTERAAMAEANRLFQGIRERVYERQLSLFEPLITAVSLLADSPELKNDNADAMRQAFLTVVELHPQMYEIYAGFESGKMYEVFSFADDGEAHDAGAPEGARFAEHIVEPGTDGNHKETWVYFDEFRVETERHTGLTRYDPRVRPWYKQARATPGEIVKTPPYVFSTSTNIGLTFAKAFYGFKSGVVAADVTMNQLSRFLRQFRTTDDRSIFTFDESGRLTAHGTPDLVVNQISGADGMELEKSLVSDLKSPVADEMLSLFHEKGAYDFATIEIDGVVYLTTVSELPRRIGTIEYLAFAVPRDEFMASALETARNSLLWAILIVALFLPVIILVSRRISRPLMKLAVEAETIRRFELEQPVTVESRILEIDDLAQSVGSMKNALNQISKFVPKAMVQDLIETKASMAVGGERRELSFLFTDVRDFTPMSEAMEPEELMRRMSDYFEVLVQVILKHEGTVDKYVGDAIFSYWNAPRLQEDHVVKTCRAALAARTASNVMNEAWIGQGRDPWYTRFGVHMGAAVVGNVGSSDRIDYTVIGNAVNIASRLEGLNKIYGTQILVSGPVVERTSDLFLYRRIDRVMPKGALKPLDIYELICAYDEVDSVDITAKKSLCADWEITYESYDSHDWARALNEFEAFASRHPEDMVVRLYLERITIYMMQPPPQEWDGVTHFQHK